MKLQSDMMYHLIDSHPDSLVSFDLQGRIKFVSSEVEKEYGLTRWNYLGKSLLELDLKFPEAKALKKAHEEIMYVAKNHKPLLTEKWINTEQGPRCFEFRHFPEYTLNREVVGVYGVRRDITNSALLSDSLNFLAKLGSADSDFLFTHILRYLGKMLGIDYVLLQTLSDLENTLEIKALYGIEGEFSQDLSGSLCDFTLKSSALGYLNSIIDHVPNDPLLIKLDIQSGLCKALLGASGDVLGFLTVLNTSNLDDANIELIHNIADIFAGRLTSELEKERVMKLETARQEDFRLLVENSPDYIFRFNAKAECIYFNPQLQRLGWTPKGIPGFEDSVDQKAFIERIQSVIDTGKDIQYLFEAPELVDTPVLYIDIKIVAEKGPSGESIGALVIGRDVTQRMQLEKVLREQASTDALTGLYNRRVFTERLQQEIAVAKRTHQPLAVLFIDLDRFKEVNDTLGHELGDDLLIQSAKRLTHNLRESDVVARFGGDEFIVLLTGFNDVSSLARMAQSLIYTLDEPYTLNSSMVYVSASLGIALYPTDAQGTGELISCADQAMYAAKQEGRNGYRFFTKTMQIDVEERMGLMNDLRKGLCNHEFYMVYQPIVDTVTKKIVKAESLIRWVHPEKGMVSPVKFVPLAEDCGFIIELGHWIFKQAIDFALLWREQVHDNSLQVSINISPRQFTQEGVVDQWLLWLEEAQLPENAIVIEITEGLLLDDKPHIVELLTKLRDAGIQLAIDDFGTGYSAMSYLKKFHIDYLKIDGSFVRDLSTDESDCAIAETIVMMAAKLGMKSIAECVETIEQQETLLSFGCDYLQGYLYAKPMTSSEFFAFLNNLNSG